MEIRPGLHRISSYVQNRLLVQFAVIEGNEAVLIDTGFAETPGHVIVPYLQSIGLSVGSVKAALVTHCDIDHYGGCGELRRLCPDIRFYAHGADRAYMEDSELNWKERFERSATLMERKSDEGRKAAFLQMAGTDIPFDGELKDGMRLSDIVPFGEEYRVLHLPGHTAGHIGLYDESHGMAIIADAILGEGTPDRDGRLLFPPGLSSVPDYRATVKRLQRLPVETLLCSHFPVMTKKQASDFIWMSGDFIDEAENALRELLETAEQPMTLSETDALLFDVLGKWPISWKFKMSELTLPLVDTLPPRLRQRIL